jgi:hypothetical protein
MILNSGARIFMQCRTLMLCSRNSGKFGFSRILEILNSRKNFGLTHSPLPFLVVIFNFIILFLTIHREIKRFFHFWKIIVRPKKKFNFETDFENLNIVESWPKKYLKKENVLFKFYFVRSPIVLSSGIRNWIEHKIHL